jgi:diguanylate cyclase
MPAPSVRELLDRPPGVPQNFIAVAAAFATIVLLGIADLLFSNLHVGALVVIPMLVLAYYTRPLVALGIALVAAPLFAALDHDWLAVIPASGFSLPVDAVILAVSFGAVVLLVDRLRRRDMSHAKLSADYEHMRVLAERDRLTDLPNRAVFFERLRELLTVATREGDSHGVLFFDLDGFKSVNDRFGHATGDRVLLMVGARLRSMLRDFGVVARIGGDEFAAVVEHVRDRNDLARVAFRIEQTLTKPFVVGRDELTLGVSVGSALFPDDATDADSLLARADVDMYRAKRSKTSR